MNKAFTRENDAADDADDDLEAEMAAKFRKG